MVFLAGRKVFYGSKDFVASNLAGYTLHPDRKWWALL